MIINNKFMCLLNNRQKELLRYVKIAHGDQKRTTGEPYFYHLLNVASILQSYGYTELTEIALCHDLIEDVDGFNEKKLFNTLDKSGYKELESNFIVLGVVSLTDVFTTNRYPELNREKRKELECKRLSHIPSIFQIVKCADIMDNTKSTDGLDNKFIKTYLKECENILLNFFNISDHKLYINCLNQIAEKQKQIV